MGCKLRGLYTFYILVFIPVLTGLFEYIASKITMCNFQDWVEEEYPPYANGPGYIISSDIARFVASEFERQKLKVHLQFFFLSHLDSVTVFYF
jgi:hypothetical protein